MEGISKSSNYAKGLGAVNGYIGQQGMEAAGSAMSIVHKIEPESVVMEIDHRLVPLFIEKQDGNWAYDFHYNDRLWIQ